MSTHPDFAVSRLAMVSPAGASEPGAKAIGPADAYPRACIHELVLDRARRSPDTLAIVAVESRLTFADVDRLSARVARRLSAAGVLSGGTVAICAERTPAMMVGLLGILRAGCAYVPLDPTHPSQRLDYIIEDSAAGAVLIGAGLEPVLGDHRRPLVSLEGLDEEADAGPDDAPHGSASPDNLAYLIYTSGSTGRPKGVEVPHSAVVNLLIAMTRQLGIDASATVLATSTYAFDASVPELWLPLLTGARMVLATRDEVTDPRQLARLIESSGATFMQATASAWQLLVDSEWQGSPQLVAVSMGETLRAPLASALLSRTRELWNAYGPTETTVYSTLGPVLPDDERVTVGRPLANTEVRILDEHLRPLPAGVPGEIVISGDGLARGYRGQPQLTALAFVTGPQAGGDRMYRTGDRGRLLLDGRIEHLGRLDDQVKVRGFRIEPGEIESALLTQNEVVAAVVVARDDPSGDRRLVAYVVPKDGAIDISSLRARLATTLPGYMIPSVFAPLSALPLTASGKLDRAALPDPADAAWHRGGSAPRRRTPGSPLETRLVRIWERVLGVRGVAPYDDFFELGGHSLLAVRMLVHVERELGVEVPLSAFFNGDVTVAGLAAATTTAQADGARDPSTSTAVAVRSGGDSDILFFIHPDESSLLTLRHFLGPFGQDRRILGLLPERTNRRFDRTRTVEELAARMLRDVRTSQPHGPYHLAGYSIGGLLAYEITGRLRDAGEEVRWLALLDAGTPAAEARYLQDRLTLRQRLIRQRQRGLREAVRKTGEIVVRETRALLVWLHLRTSGDDFDWRGATQMAFRYRCQDNHVPMDLFVTDDLIVGTGDPTLGWGEVHGGPLRVHKVAGEHRSMLQKPHVAALAEALAASLRTAVERAAAPE